jgi:hypothetical protein
LRAHHVDTRHAVSVPLGGCMRSCVVKLDVSKLASFLLFYRKWIGWQRLVSGKFDTVSFRGEVILTLTLSEPFTKVGLYSFTINNTKIECEGLKVEIEQIERDHALEGMKSTSRPQFQR